MEDPNEIVKKLFDDVDVCINAVEKALPSIIMEQYARESALVVDSMPKNNYPPQFLDLTGTYYE